MQYLLTLRVSRYCILALHNSTGEVWLLYTADTESVYWTIRIHVASLYTDTNTGDNMTSPDIIGIPNPFGDRPWIWIDLYPCY